MILRPLSSPHRVLIVAEIGNNHEGSFEVAQELVARAAEAGVDAVKFQTFRTEHYVSRTQTERFARLKRFELSRDQFTELAAQARRLRLLFLSTPFDLDSAKFLATIVDAIKIASGDNTFYPLLETAALTGKPLIVSTGLATLPQIAFAKALVERIWAERGIDGHLGLLHCVSAYPVPEAEANLAAIRSLERAFSGPSCTIGYSDHTLGVRACVLAVALGARLLEKHFTLDRNFSDFRDHQLSADPVTMKQLVQEVREAETLLGTGTKAPGPCELAGLEATRRSVAVARDLPAGAVVSPEDLTWVRPGSGLAPGQEARVLGRKLRRSMSSGTVVTLDDLE